MDTSKIVELIQKALPFITTAVSTGKSYLATPFFKVLAKVITGGKVGADEQQEVEAEIARLEASILRPLPPAQPGDPDFKA